MSAPLFERCAVCAAARAANPGLACLACRGTGFVETWLTAGQVGEIAGVLGRIQEMIGPCPRAGLPDRVRRLQELARRAGEEAEAADAVRCLAEIGEMVGFGESRRSPDDRRRLVREVRAALGLRLGETYPWPAREE